MLGLCLDLLQVVYFENVLPAFADSLLEAWLRLLVLEAFLEELGCERLCLLPLQVAKEFLGLGVATPFLLLENLFDFVQMFGLLIDGGPVGEDFCSVRKSPHVNFTGTSRHRRFHLYRMPTWLLGK